MLTNKKILITNDDGVDAPGLITLVKEIYKYTTDIMVLAPTVEMSAVSHTLILRRGLKLEQKKPLYKDVLTYCIDGSPADCVKFAYVHFGFKPDYVISGLNNGLNIGDDILYSGTVAAVFEAGLMGSKGIAFSCEREDYEHAKEYICKSLEYINTTNLKNEELLNINIPTEVIGYKIVHQGRNPFNTRFDLIDGLYYALGTPCGASVEKDPDTDILAIHNGYVAIMPLTTDRTKKN